MKYVKELPFYSELDEDKLECGLWQAEENVCELKDDGPGACDTSGLYYATTDDRETKFCARHFYRSVVNGDGVSNYRLADKV